MKRKFVFFALLAACVSATCSMCGNDSDTPEYEFPDGPEPEPEPEPDAYPHGLTVTEFADDLADGKRCLGFVATADPKANPKLRFNAVHLPVQKTPTRIHADFDSENRGKPCVTTNAGYWWAGNSLSLLVSGGVVESIENQTVTRDGKTVYPVRASFGQMASGEFETHWIYCVSDDGNRPYAFPSPLDNDERTGTYMPAPPTSKTPGAALWTPQEAVGGGPMLVKEGRNVAEECYWREVFDGGGIAGTSRQPRTAVGATADGKLLLLVCDGRGMRGSEGFTLAELAEIFDISGISKSPAVFDINKLRWMNAEYMKKLSPEAFFAKAEPVLKTAVTNPAVDLRAVAALVQPRCEILSDLPERVDFIDKLPEYSTELYVHKKSKTTLENSLSSLQAIVPVLEGLQTWTNESLYEALVALAAKLEVKNSVVLWPLRVAVSGKASTPGGATELCALLGKEESLARIRTGIELLSK
mgnify:CR=1 FL=1